MKTEEELKMVFRCPPCKTGRQSGFAEMGTQEDGVPVQMGIILHLEWQWVHLV